MTKKVYNLTHSSHELLSVSDADESPLEPGVYLLPALATFDEPPPQLPGKVRQYKDGAWIQVDENRGSWFLADQSQIEVVELSGEFDTTGKTRTPPPGPYYDLVDGEWVLNEFDKRAYDNYNFQVITQNLLDSTAKSHGYDNILAAISYAEESAVPKFQNDGKSFRQWRSLVWEAWNKVVSDALDSKQDLPDPDAFLESLPKLVIVQFS